MATGQPRVIVIGAGVSGLPAIKSCLEEGLPVTCYDESDSIGGLWKYREDGMSCMKSTFMNSSKEWTAFSDFPAPAEFPNYFSHAKYLQYLTMYAEKYNLLPHIRLEHRVVWITKMPNYNETGQWSVRVRNKQGQEETIVAFAVMVCVGAFATPSIPKFKGIESFQGIIKHSKNYKTPDDMTNKNVLVIGSGNTAGDIAVEVGRLASKTYFVLNRELLHVGRIGPKGLPNDTADLTRFGLWKTEHFISNDAAVRHVSEGPSLKVDKHLYNLHWGNFKYGSKIRFINDELPLSILKGSVQIKNPVHTFTEEGVIFEGEERRVYPVDAVILATGYKISMGMLDENAVSKEDLIRGLYRRVFPAHLPHPTIAFIGCCLKYVGSNSQASELQARWAARVFAKKQKLPPLKAIKRNLTNYDKLLNEQKSVQAFGVIEYYPYIDDIANEFGAKPNLLKLMFTDPVLFWACAFGPMVAYQYRINGPHSWSGARKAILTVHDRILAPFNTRPNPPRHGMIKDRSFKWALLLIVVAAFILYAWELVGLFNLI